MMNSNYLRGICSLVVFPFLGYCCTTQLSPVYSQLSGSASFQFSITPPSTYKIYEIRNKDGVPVLRTTYSPTPGAIVMNDNIYTFTGDTSTGNLSITLKSVQQDDYGIYNLINASTILQCRTLYILGKPTAALIGSNPDPEAGGTVILTCTSVSTTLPKDRGLSMKYSWTVDGATNPTDSRYTYSTSRHTLTLSDVTKEDSSKVFRCTATEVVTGGLTSDTSSTYSVNVLYGPDTVTLVPNKPSYTENEGTALSTIQCSADCNPPCTYKWTKQGQISAVNNTATLSLGSLHRSEAGNYTCTAKSTRQEAVQVIVSVRYAPNVTTFLSHDSIVENSTLQLKCIADGVPNIYTYTAITHTWRGTTIANTRLPISNTPVYSSLQFTNLQLEDTGTYTCHVNNGVKDLHGKLDQTATVIMEVKVSPKVLTDENKYAGVIHDSVNINIPFYSDSITSMTFGIKNGIKITNGAKYQVSDMSEEVATSFYGTPVKLDGKVAQLKIRDLQEKDFTSYTLTLTNKINTTVYTFDVASEGIPLPPKIFFYLELFDGVPRFYWEEGFNGWHEQFFVIETTVIGTGNWIKHGLIVEGDQLYQQVNKAYIANITGLAPGQYSARLTAENKLGPIGVSDRPTVIFTIQETHIPSDTKGNNTAEIIGAFVGGIAFAAMVIAVIFIVRRQRKLGKCTCLQVSNTNGQHQDASKDQDVYYNMASTGPSTEGINLNESDRNTDAATYETAISGNAGEHMYTDLEASPKGSNNPHTNMEMYENLKHQASR